jgi:hypothetical protein
MADLLDQAVSDASCSTTPSIPLGQGNALHTFSMLPNGTLSEQLAPIVFQYRPAACRKASRCIPLISPDQGS